MADVIDPEMLKAFQEWQKRQGARKEVSKNKRVAFQVLHKRHKTELDKLIAYCKEHPEVDSDKVPATIR